MVHFILKWLNQIGTLCGCVFPSITARTLKITFNLAYASYFYCRIDNDIAILKLSRDVELNDNVVPACLPSSTSTQYFGNQATVSGTVEDIPSIHKIYMRSSAPYLHHEKRANSAFNKVPFLCFGTYVAH